MTAARKVVFVVEDTEANMVLCHDVLHTHGYSVVQAADGDSGCYHGDANE